MNKIKDGFLYGVGAVLAFHLMGFLLTVGLYLAMILFNKLMLLLAGGWA